eukprot:g3835.t1
MRYPLFFTVIFLLIALPINGFYLPGEKPHDYTNDDPVKVVVGALVSSRTQTPQEWDDRVFNPEQAQVEEETSPTDTAEEESEINTKLSPMDNDIDSDDSSLANYFDVQSEDLEEDSERVLPLNLGELLAGQRFRTLPFDLHFKEHKGCTIFSAVNTSNAFALGQLNQLVHDEYLMNLYVDGLPAAEYRGELKHDTPPPKSVSDLSDDSIFAPGFFIGGIDKVTGKAYLNNHLHFYIFYNGPRVVRFLIEAVSLDHQIEEVDPIQPDKSRLQNCNVHNHVPRFIAMQDPYPIPRQTIAKTDLEKPYIYFTYDVQWSKCGTNWSNRWEVFFTYVDTLKKYHWMHIINVFAAVLVFVTITSCYIIRMLHIDIQRYNSLYHLDKADIEMQRQQRKEYYLKKKRQRDKGNEDSNNIESLAADVIGIDLEDEREDDLLLDGTSPDGWKNIHANVFRTPSRPLILCALAGSGFHLFLVTIATCSLGLLGLLSPARGGALPTAIPAQR